LFQILAHSLQSSKRVLSYGLQNQRKEMNCYETLFVVKPTLTEQEIASQVTKIKDILTREGAELIATDDMGMRRLAYAVKTN
jgi:ribosomal protein S6